MKVRKHSKADKVELQMTAMIDVVFQLLVFFIMTFNIVEAEGDFAIQLPGAPGEVTDTEVAPVKLKLRMTADADGQLVSATLDGAKLNSQTPFADLHNRILGKVDTSAGPSEEKTKYEVEIQCDYHLKYDNVIQAITAVSGKKEEINGQDEIITLIDMIRFSPPVGGSKE